MVEAGASEAQSLARRVWRAAPEQLTAPALHHTAAAYHSTAQSHPATSTAL